MYECVCGGGGGGGGGEQTEREREKDKYIEGGVVLQYDLPNVHTDSSTRTRPNRVPYTIVHQN